MRDYKNKWELAVHAYNGTGGFSDGSYLDKYPRESDDKIEERKKVAFFDSIFKQKVSRYVGYIYRHKPMRVTSSSLMRLIFDDADKIGNNMDVFMSSFAHEAKVRGSMLLLVDMPKEIPSNHADQMAQRAVPYFVPIEPERIDSYKIDMFGKFEWVRFTDTIDESTPEESVTKDVIRYYDDKGWKVYDGDKVIDKGEYSIDMCPVLQFSESGSFPCVGEFTQIGQLAKRHYNMNSELDEILRAQTFSLLTIQATSPKDVEINIGTDNAMAYSAQMDRPEFIAPPSAPADTYRDRIKSIEERINEIAYDTSTSNSAESGISLEIKFQGLNGSLGNFAMRLNDIEIRALYVAARYLGIDYDCEISYPSEFNIVDIQEEIATLDNLKALGYKLPN